MSDEPISAEFPFESRFIDVLGSGIHYVEKGDGDPILFLHGNPTSAYLWRNILLYLTSHGRCIAPDLIGMGGSEKPNIGYRFFEHSAYIEAFIDKMELSNVTLVIHDWGSAIGFHYAARHEKNVKALAFMEAMVKPLRWTDLPPDFKMGFQLMRMPTVGWLMISVMNTFVKQILPKAIVRELSPEEQRSYEAPFPTINSRRPVRRWPMEIPIDGSPRDVHNMMSAYSEWLQETPISKLLFYAEPGGIINGATLEWCKMKIKNLETINLGKGIHYLQEDHPHEIGRALAAWYHRL